MSKNLMTEICKELNVELGEEFKVDIYGDRIFRITKSGLWEKKIADDDHCDIWEEQLVVLRELLIGDVEIVKLPWKPEFEDSYYTFTLAQGKWVVCIGWWEKEPHCYALFDKGWIYRTRAEAEAALPAVAAEMGVQYEL